MGRERILEAARKEKLLLSQPAVRSILGIFREYGLARVGTGKRRKPYNHPWAGR